MPEPWFEELYGPCLSCTAPCHDVLNANVDPAIDRRYVPRGFYSEGNPGSVVVMVVAMNPGGGNDPAALLEEPRLYCGPVAAVLDEQRDFIRRQFANPRRGYHRKLSLQIGAFLGLPANHAMRHTVITELFKCTTLGDGMASSDTIDRCVNLHLVREIKVWNPNVVLCLGKEVTTYFQSRPDLFDPATIKRLTHPSYYGIPDQQFRLEAQAVFASLTTEIKGMIHERLQASPPAEA